MSGIAGDVYKTAKQAPNKVQLERTQAYGEYSLSVDNGYVTVNAPARSGNSRADACNDLYAKARGTIAAAYGEPQTETEHSMDALVASIVASRGTNGAGLGWVPPPSPTGW